jgi:uncharacterized protein YbbK (DUF523 family)
MTSFEPSAALHDRFSRLHDPDPQVAVVEAVALAVAAAATGKRVVAVSACLLGERVRYDGGHKHAPDAVAPLLDDPGILVVPLCPEILARMGCPRPTVSFTHGDGATLVEGLGGRIVDSEGRDRTHAMALGAELAERLCEVAGVSLALLKENSPSCGPTLIHGPEGLQAGSGVFAARLARRGIPLSSESEPLPGLDED